MIVEMDLYYKIRALYNEGESQRSIAKRLGVSRQTVKKYCEGNTHPEVRKAYHREPEVLTQDVIDFIRSCLDEDREEHLSKQWHTAKRIYDRLYHEKGFRGAESTVRNAVKAIRAEMAIPSQADIPLEYDSGDAVQIDWGEATAYINDQKTKFNFFCGRLCFSCAIFVQAFYSQNTESFLEAQQRMFDFFGGVPRRIIFDNAKVAVKDGFGKHAKATDKYSSFAAHYAFQTDFCNIASGNEKGLVENLVGYARKNFMVPVPRVSSIEELNEHLLNDCRHYIENHKVKSKSLSVKEAYDLEKVYLHSVPLYRYDTSKTEPHTVGDYSTIRFDKNNYSVPVSYLRKDVTVKGYANVVHIFHENVLIATHNRVYGSNKTEYRLEHYIDLLEIKPRAIFQAVPVKATVDKELLDWGRQLPGGNHEMVKLLRLCVDHGVDKVLNVKHSLPPGIVPTVDIIRAGLHEFTDSNIIHFKKDIDVLSTDLSKYDELCGVITR